MEKAFARFIAGKKILIADPSGVSRAVIAQTLASMGARTPDLILAHTYEMAESEIARQRPLVVISDYDLGRRCGLDLLEKQRAARPESRDTLFILVTGNTSQTAVARAAEEDIDSYIVKPFTIPTLKASILKAVMLKIQPPPYLAEIELGRAALAQGRIDEALGILEKAKTLDSAPALACFYLGQARMLRKDFDAAIEEFQEGLGHNPLHYKCLVGLHEALLAKGEHQRAYDVIRKIAHYFPANPQRLTAVLRLAILTGHFEDVERYYEIFKDIDQRSPEMIRHVCAALVVCGKHFLKEGRTERATDLFHKASITCGARPRILREIIVTLVDAGQVRPAEEFLLRFPPETQSQADYAACNLLLTDRIQGRDFAIMRGREYVKQGLRDPMIYQILIQRSYEAGFDEAADDLAKEAVKRWPDQSDAFSRPPVTSAPA